MHEGCKVLGALIDVTRCRTLGMEEDFNIRVIVQTLMYEQRQKENERLRGKD